MTGDFRVGPWLAEPSLNVISRNGSTVHLEPKVMEVLVCLAEHPGETLSKETLLQAVWPETFVADDALKHCIFELRRVFEDDAREPRVIQTIARRGYRLIAPVESVNGINQSSTLIGVAPTHRVVGWSAHRWWVGAATTLILVSVLLVAMKKSFRSASAGGLPPIHSLAVLPLQNLSSDPAQGYFSDGMTDALITDLAQISSLPVISRTSSMQYKQTRKSLPEIARELKVDGIVEGTVQRSGDRVRITAQLIQGATDKHLWANSYEGDMQDVFLLERDVAGDIAQQVQARVTAQDQKPPASLRPVNPNVLEAYLQGNYHRERLGKGSGDEAARTGAAYFQQAIDADPSFAPAYRGLAWAHFYLLWPSRQDAEIAREAAGRALALDPSSSEAHGMLAEIKRLAWDWAGAEQEYRRAIALNANDSGARREFGHLLDATGRQDEGWREQLIAQELDPANDHLSEGLAMRRQYDREIAQLQMMLKRDPDNGYLHVSLYKVYAKKGMYREAIQQLERTLILFGYPQEAAQVRKAFAVSGHAGAIREFARALEHLMATGQAFVPVNIAEAYAILGDKDRAFYWLEQAYARHDIGMASTDMEMYFLKTDFLFDPIRTDPRFKDLLRRIGLPQ
jgi:TolB-like protein/DNA-binding winged helix-turn-helix (wHTH) protein